MSLGTYSYSSWQEKTEVKKNCDWTDLKDMAVLTHHYGQLNPLARMGSGYSLYNKEEQFFSGKSVMLLLEGGQGSA